MSETLDFCMPDGLAEHARELERSWPGMLADLRASRVPLNEGGDPAADVGDQDPGLETDPAGEPRADGDPAPDPALEPSPAPQAAEPDWNNVDTLRAAAARLQEMGYTIAPTEQPQQEEVEWDPYDQQQVLRAIEQSPLGQALAAVLNETNASRAEKVETQIDGLLGRVAQEANLEGVDIGRLRAVADSFAGEAGRQYGQTPQAAEYAAKKAAEWITAERKSAGDAAVRAYQESIGQVADTPGEPGFSGGGTLIEPRPKSYDEIIAKHTGRLASA